MQQHFINGRCAAGSSGETVPVIDPCTGQVVEQIARAAPPRTSTPRCKLRAAG